MIKLNNALISALATVVFTGWLGSIVFYADIVKIPPKLRIWLITENFPVFFINDLVYFLGFVLACFHTVGVFRNYEWFYFRVICCCFCCLVLFFIYFSMQVGYVTQFQFVVLFYFLALYFTEYEKQKKTV